MSFAKLVAVWLVMASLMLVVGVFSQLLFIPVLGLEAGEMMQAFLGLAIVFGVTRWLLSAQAVQPRARALRIGATWFVLALVFEVSLGRTLQLTGPGIPRYGMWDGSFWPIIVIATALAPVSLLSRGGLRAHGVTK